MSCRPLMRAAMAAVVGAMLTCQGQVQGAPVVAGRPLPIFLNIQSSASGGSTPPQLLDASGGTAHLQCGTPVILGTPNVPSITTNQLWSYNYADRTITTAGPQEGTVMCLTTVSTGIVVCGCNGNSNQRWTWQDDGIIESPSNSACLASNGVGAQLGLQTCSSSPNKLFSQQVTCRSGLAKNLLDNACLTPRQLFVKSSGQRLDDNNAQKSSLATVTNNIITTENSLWVLDTSIFPGICGGEPCGLMYTLASRALLKPLCLDAANPGNPTQPWFQNCDPASLSQRWSWSRAAVAQDPDPRVIAIIARSLVDTWLNGNNAPNVTLIYPFFLPVPPFWILP